VSIPNLRKRLFSKDGIGIEIKFEFKKVVRGILQEKCHMFEGGIRKSSTRITEKCESVLSGPVQNLVPFLFCAAGYTKVSRVNTFLWRTRVVCEMGHDLVTVKIQGDGDRGLAAYAASQAFNIKFFGGFNVFDWNGKMKDRRRHVWNPVSYYLTFPKSVGKTLMVLNA
jgi:hypothetical protein